MKYLSIFAGALFSASAVRRINWQLRGGIDDLLVFHRHHRPQPT